MINPIVGTEDNMTGTDALVGYLYLGKNKECALQAFWTGTAEGQFKIYASVKNASGGNQGGSDPEWEDTDWEELTDGEVDVTSGDGAHLWEITSKCPWLKIVYTNTTGTGTLNVEAYIK